MAKSYRIFAVAAKIESPSGTDAVPTPAANVITVRNGRATPIAMNVESRELMRSYLGNSEDIVVARWFEYEFEVEMVGSGAAGTAPDYDPIMRLTGHSKTVNAGVDVVYAPVSSAFETGSVYINLDGLLHKTVMSMASLGWDLSAGKIPVWKVKGKGLFRPMTDISNWTPTYGNHAKPVGVTYANTTGSLHGVAAPIETLTVDTAAQIEYRNLINFEGVQYTDRKPAGNISLEMTSIATKDWATVASDATTGVLNIVHGTVAGNIVEIDCPNAQITQPQYGNSQNVLMLQCGLKLMPGASGNDEYTITIR